MVAHRLDSHIVTIYAVRQKHKHSHKHNPGKEFTQKKVLATDTPVWSVNKFL